MSRRKSFGFTMCEECDRLWRQHSDAIQQSFRLEERLRRGRICQDVRLANSLAAKLEDVAQEAVRTRRALEDHQSQAHLNGVRRADDLHVGT
jgi:hypothetical protein